MRDIGIEGPDGVWERESSGSVFTNHSLERSLSYSPDFSIFRSIWMKHNFWLAKPYGLANQKLCYIQSYKSWRKRQRMFLRIVGEYGPRKLICKLGHRRIIHSIQFTTIFRPWMRFIIIQREREREREGLKINEWICTQICR